MNHSTANSIRYFTLSLRPARGLVKDEIRQQLHDGFEGADYPVNSPMDLVPALPNGPSTTFESGDVSFTAMELNSQAGGRQDFPYEDVEPLVDDVMNGLEDEGYFEGN